MPPFGACKEQQEAAGAKIMASEERIKTATRYLTEATIAGDEGHAMDIKRGRAGCDGYLGA